MRKHVRNIGAAELDYVATGTFTAYQNSNSVVTSVLNAVGINVADTLPFNTSINEVTGWTNLLDIDTNLTGTDANDIIRGAGGDDELHGGNGADEIYGNAGDDFIEGNSGNDILYGGSGDDVINGGTGDDKIVGGEGVDILLGGSGNDILRGGYDSSIDDLSPDSLEGGEGYDVYFINSNSGNIVSDSDGSGQIIRDGQVFELSANAIGQNYYYDETTGTIVHITDLDGDGQADDAEVFGSHFQIHNFSSGDLGITLNDVQTQNLTFSDTLEGSSGIDSLLGGQDDDLYVFNRGDGGDFISDTQGVNRIRFGASH